MKRKFISAMLFGALMVAPATTFVGCADYDDDIENLQGQITNNATTLDELTKEKIANVETEIKSLKDAQAQLKEAQEKATTDGDAATLAAATQLVNEAQARLQAALDAVNGEISDVNGSISALDARLAVADGKLSSVEALLAADGKITLAINDAQAMADKAYALAEQTAATANENKEAIKAAADNLKSIKESLEDQINTLSGKVNDLSSQLAEQNAALTAQIASLENQLKEAKDGNAANADKINANEGKINELTTQLNSLKEQVAANKLAVETLESNMLSKIQEVVNSTNTSINQLKEANAAAEERLTKAEGRLDTIDDLIASIQSTKADDAAIRELIANVKSELQNAQGVDKAALEQKISDLTAIVNGKASKDELDNAIDNLKSTIENAQGVDKAALEQKINDLDNRIQTDLNKKADKSYVDEKIRDLNNKFGELQASLDGLKKEDGTPIQNFAEAIAAVQRNVNTVSNDITRIDREIARIDGLVSVLFTNLNSLITGVINQQIKFDGVYAKVTNRGRNTDATKNYSEFFGQKRTLNEYSVEQLGGSLLATINPTNVDFSNTKLALKDSKDATNSFFVLTPAMSAENEPAITRSAASKNGLYKYYVATTLTDDKATDGKNAHEKTFATDPTTDRKAYALCAEYEWLKKDGKKDENRGVYSKYEVGFDLTAAQKATFNDLTITSDDARLSYTDAGWENGGHFTVRPNDGTLKFTLKLNTGGKKVLAKYITCTNFNNGAGSVVNTPNAGKLGTVLYATNKQEDGSVTVNSNFSEFSIDAAAFNGNNKDFYLDYYVWNYDGSVAKKTIEFTVTKPMFISDDLKETLTPNASGTLSHRTAFDKNTCLTGDNYNVWKTNSKTFKVEPVTDANNHNISGPVSKVTLTKSNAALAEVSTTVTNGVGASTSITNIDKINGMTFEYDPSQLEVGKTYSFDVVFDAANGNEVTRVRVNYGLGKLTENQGLVSPLAEAFTGKDIYTTDAEGNKILNWGYDWGTTVAYAQYEPGNPANGTPAYAYYKLEASFNNVGITKADGSYIEFRDSTNYTIPANAPYQPKNGMKFTNEIRVPLAAVSQTNAKGEHIGHTYLMEVAVRYFGLDNLWNAGNRKKFKLSWKSPIYYAKDFSFNQKELNYPGDVELNDNDIKGYDPSYSGNEKIHFLGGASQDHRIASMAVELADLTQEGLIKSVQLLKADNTVATNGIGATKIHIVSKNSVSLQHATTVPFKLTIVDKFGCTLYKTFYISIKPNTAIHSTRR